MELSTKAESEQSWLWNGPAGHAWVEMQGLLDQLFRPFEEVLLDAVETGGDCKVLDIGCGAGATTLAAARKLAGQGSATGIDISEPLVAAARARSWEARYPAEFILGDAESHRFPHAAFDAFISRFGVMFFGDSTAAFANLRGAAKPGASLNFVAWRSAAENQFMTTAERAAAPLLPDMPAREPNTPGQFAFADPDRVDRILQESGWVDIDIAKIDVECSLPEANIDDYLTRLGPLGVMLQSADRQTRDRILERVRPAFDQYRHDGEIRFWAACWMVKARARRG